MKRDEVAASGEEAVTEELQFQEQWVQKRFPFESIRSGETSPQLNSKYRNR